MSADEHREHTPAPKTQPQPATARSRSVASASAEHSSARPVETDWRLFTTLLRFDAVYSIHFRCSLRRIVDYPNLWPYLRDLYQRPGIADTTRFDEIRAHYYRTHPEVNPSGLVALRPLADFDAPHEREHLA